jgi:hypothetical protein
MFKTGDTALYYTSEGMERHLHVDTVNELEGTVRGRLLNSDGSFAANRHPSNVAKLPHINVTVAISVLSPV